jgi:glycosyltransferase involved in cell wall biosynthesis
MLPADQGQEQPVMSVVLCSHNGAGGVERCLQALREQTISGQLELIVVDDGSADNTAAVASSCGARVVSHPVNRGLSAARNSGIAASGAPIVAFLDDDCVPYPDWAERLLAGYVDDVVVGVGGIVLVSVDDGIIGSYLERHNPIRAIDFRVRVGLAERAASCFRPPRTDPRGSTRRKVWALVGANMSFRREALLAVSGFDERFFSADDVDISHRIHLYLPTASLLFEPTARVEHVFKSTLHDLIRRGRAYGGGSGLMYLKWWRRMPKLYRRPAAVALLCCAGWKARPCRTLALLAPILMCPDSIHAALADRSAAPLLDGYLELVKESSEAAGYLSTLYRLRDIPREVQPGTAEPVT